MVGIIFRRIKSDLKRKSIPDDRVMSRKTPEEAEAAASAPNEIAASKRNIEIVGGRGAEFLPLPPGEGRGEGRSGGDGPDEERFRLPVPPSPCPLPRGEGPYCSLNDGFSLRPRTPPAHPGG